MQYQTDYPPLLCTTSRVSPRSVSMRWSGAEPNTYGPIGIMTSGAGVHTPMSCASYMIIFSTPTLHKHFRAPSNVSNTCRLNTSSSRSYWVMRFSQENRFMDTPSRRVRGTGMTSHLVSYRIQISFSYIMPDPLLIL